MKDQSFQALVLSLAIHGLWLWLAIHIPPNSIRAHSQPVEIQIVEKDKKDAKTFVPDLSTEEKLLEKLKEQANFLSKFNQRVKEQLKARAIDKTQNHSNSQLAQNRPNQESAPQGQRQKPTGPGPRMHLRPAGEGIPRQIVMGPSSVGEIIPGVKEGSFTALNTDQFIFYSFFSRVNEQIRYRWVTNIRQFGARQSPADIRLLSQYPRISEVEIVLDSQGNYVESHVFRSSGFPDLDRAAIEAFIQAAPLQNPPAEMVEGDGFIRLHYSFQVEWRPYQFAGSSN